MIITNKARSLDVVFAMVREAESQEEKIKILRAYNTKAMRWLVSLMYARDLSMLPSVDYTPSHRPEGVSATMNTVIQRVESAFRVYDINPQKYNDLMNLSLESLTSGEAELLVNVMRGKKVQGVSKAVWKQLYPEFFRDEDQDSDTTQSVEKSVQETQAEGDS